MIKKRFESGLQCTVSDSDVDVAHHHIGAVDDGREISHYTRPISVSVEYFYSGDLFRQILRSCQLLQIPANGKIIHYRPLRDSKQTGGRTVQVSHWSLLNDRPGQVCDETKMASPANKNVLSCVNTVTEKFQGEFILIGGASMVIRQCDRTTTDVDVLVPMSTNLDVLYQQLLETTWFFREDGKIFIKPSRPVSMDNPFPRPLQIDILTAAVDDIRYDDLIPQTVVVDGNLMLSLSMSLGVKLRCWYLRVENVNSMSKQRSDLEDIVFLSSLMRKQGLEVDPGAAAVLKISHYNLLLIRLELLDEQIETIRLVGCNRFLRKYEDDSPEQREYYEAMGAKPNTDPLVVELEDD